MKSTLEVVSSDETLTVDLLSMDSLFNIFFEIVSVSLIKEI